MSAETAGAPSPRSTRSDRGLKNHLLSPLAALPPYPGGKRRLVPLIFAAVAEALPREAWSDSVFFDPFLGGGSVALSAKCLGFGNVLASDAAERSAVIGRALIANSEVRLSNRDLQRLLAPALPTDRPRPKLLNRLPAPLRDFAERAWQHLIGDTFADAKHDLITALVLKVLLRAFPMSLPSASDAPLIVSGDFDRVSSPRLAHYLRASERLASPAMLTRLVDQQNAAVMPGRATVMRADALESIRSTAADVVYLDPPYPGTQGYQRAFSLVDEFLGDRLDLGDFRVTGDGLDTLIDAASHIDWLLLSMGNASLGATELGQVVARHRPVLRLLEIPYRHYGAVASAKKNASNRELLVLAGPSRS